MNNNYENRTGNETKERAENAQNTNKADNRTSSENRTSNETKNRAENNHGSNNCNNENSDY